MTSTPSAAPQARALPIGVVGKGPLAREIVAELQRGGRSYAEFDSAPTGERLGALSCLVLAEDDDAGNVDAALQAREVRPGLPLVVRVFDPVLEEFLSKTSPDISVLSMSGVAVPDIADIMGDSPMSTLGLGAWLRAFTGRLDRFLVGALLFIVCLTLVGTVFFSAAMRLSASDAFYFVITTITTTGYGDITPKDQSIFVKLAATGLMLLGALTFAILFALVSEWMFARRLDLVLGRVPTRWSNHVVLIGAGNMTVRLAGLLREREQRALVIEREAENPLIPVLRSDGHQVIVADATKEPTLRMAGVDRARAVLVLTSTDAENLHVALVVKSVSRDAVVWARIDSPPLARHVAESSAIRASSPLLIAARAFVERAVRT